MREVHVLCHNVWKQGAMRQAETGECRITGEPLESEAVAGRDKFIYARLQWPENGICEKERIGTDCSSLSAKLQIRSGGWVSVRGFVWYQYNSRVFQVPVPTPTRMVPPPKNVAFPNVQLDVNTIPCVDTAKKVFGLIINSSLTWQDHVDHIVTQASKQLFMLFRVKSLEQRKSSQCSCTVNASNLCRSMIARCGIPLSQLHNEPPWNVCRNRCDASSSVASTTTTVSHFPRSAGPRWRTEETNSPSTLEKN
ncbi:hypothetical protein Pcinc_014332 [Petrolisthes cinctipes]|uniref:Uncharacterized protein n=1 Tax=Petrolisthes cinctipes TaxID=88211 RepID=A0AAE1FV69_PETCI|nr:hypothetical protein Pcinc_014332 [Petrolisthes cinctipes]